MKHLCVIVAWRYSNSKKRIRRQDQNLHATVAEQMFYTVSFPQKSKKYCVPVLSGTKIPDPIFVPIQEYIGKRNYQMSSSNDEYIAALFSVLHVHHFYFRHGAGNTLKILVAV